MNHLTCIGSTSEDLFTPSSWDRGLFTTRSCWLAALRGFVMCWKERKKKGLTVTLRNKIVAAYTCSKRRKWREAKIALRLYKSFMLSMVPLTIKQITDWFALMMWNTHWLTVSLIFSYWVRNSLVFLIHWLLSSGKRSK